MRSERTEGLSVRPACSPMLATAVFFRWVNWSFVHRLVLRISFCQVSCCVVFVLEKAFRAESFRFVLVYHLNGRAKFDWAGLVTTSSS